MKAEAEEIFRGEPEPFEFGPIQTEWLEAMEEERVPQGRYNLCWDGYYCATGLLLSIARKHGVPMVVESHFNGVVNIDGQSSRPTLRTLSKVGMNGRGFSRIATYNDSNCIPFPGIAEAVRAAPTKFFEESK